MNKQLKDFINHKKLYLAIVKTLSNIDVAEPADSDSVIMVETFQNVPNHCPCCLISLPMLQLHTTAHFLKSNFHLTLDHLWQITAGDWENVTKCVGLQDVTAASSDHAYEALWDTPKPCIISGNFSTIYLPSIGSVICSNCVGFNLKAGHKRHI